VGRQRWRAPSSTAGARSGPDRGSRTHDRRPSNRSVPGLTGPPLRHAGTIAASAVVRRRRPSTKRSSALRPCRSPSAPVGSAQGVWRGVVCHRLTETGSRDARDTPYRPAARDRPRYIVEPKVRRPAHPGPRRYRRHCRLRLASRPRAARAPGPSLAPHAAVACAAAVLDGELFSGEGTEGI
jgi:hypothetical protein